MTEVRAGQVWKEVDPRFERYVVVIGVSTDGQDIRIRTCTPDGQPRPRSRPTTASVSRFNGKRTGYAFYRDGERERWS